MDHSIHIQLTEEQIASRLAPLQFVAASRSIFPTFPNQLRNLSPSKANDWSQSSVIGLYGLCGNVSSEQWFHRRADPEQSNSRNSLISSQPLLLVLKEYEIHQFLNKIWSESCLVYFIGQRQSWKAMAVNDQAMVIRWERLLHCLCKLLVMRIVESLQ